jgi:hypothetical protein
LGARARNPPPNRNDRALASRRSPPRASQQRLGAVTGAGVPAGTYNYNPAYLTLNVNGEYRISRRIVLFAVIRNISNEPLVTEIYAPITPKYARISNYQNLGSQISVGFKGEF